MYGKIIKYAVGTTTSPPFPQPQLQISQKIFKYALEIWSICDYIDKFQEPELILDGRKIF